MPMLHYTTTIGTRWTALEIRDGATFDATAALEDGRDPTARAVAGMIEDFDISESDITVGESVNGEPAPITIQCHPGEIVLTWDPMQDGYDYPASGDDANELDADPIAELTDAEHRAAVALIEAALRPSLRGFRGDYPVTWFSTNNLWTYDLEVRGGVELSGHVTLNGRPVQINRADLA